MGGWNKRHGMSKTPEFSAWVSMRERCGKPNNKWYPYYGGRGIKVCDAWANSFEAFFADMGLRPGRGYSLDRIDNARGYEPGNCRWTTSAVQMRNRDFCIQLTLNGVTKTASEWARDMGCSPSTIIRRRERGLSDEQALTKPLAIKGARAVMLHKRDNRPYVWAKSPEQNRRAAERARERRAGRRMEGSCTA